MGIGEFEYVFAGATTYRGGGGNGGSGEGDSTFVPRVRMSAAIKWPTLVIESSLSQSLASLQKKMQWWFRESNHEVKIVLLANIDRDSRTIHLEKYTTNVPQSCSAATRTRSMPGFEPHLRQAITIVPRPSTSNPIQYDVDGGPLVVEFELLFLRPADPGLGEHDVELTARQLASAAEFAFQ